MKTLTVALLLSALVSASFAADRIWWVGTEGDDLKKLAYGAPEASDDTDFVMNCTGKTSVIFIPTIKNGRVGPDTRHDVKLTSSGGSITLRATTGPAEDELSGAYNGYGLIARARNSAKLFKVLGGKGNLTAQTSTGKVVIPLPTKRAMTEFKAACPPGK